MDHLNRKGGRPPGYPPPSSLLPGILLLAAFLFLSACGSTRSAATVDPKIAATVAVIQTQNVLPVTGSTPAPNATQGAGQALTNQVPLIIVQDQAVSAGQVTVHTVISTGPGWVVIHATDPNGSIGETIGHVPVKEGPNSGVPVPIDIAKATPVLFAVLHQDAGTIGEYEYPGPDQPVTHFGQGVFSAFHTYSGATPEATDLNGMATAMSSGSGQPARGSTPSAAAASIPTPTRVASPTPAPTATTTAFPTPAATSTLPPLVKAANQPLKNSQVTIAEVVSPGNGWIVVYTSAGGRPGQVLGYTQVRNGGNQNVRVSILPLASSRTLLAVLHSDGGKPGVFEFPGTDMPVTRAQKLIWAQFNLLSQ